MAELVAQQKALEAVKASIGRIEQTQKYEQKREQGLQRLLEFSTFAAIDWRTDERLVLRAVEDMQRRQAGRPREENQECPCCSDSHYSSLQRFICRHERG